MRRLGRREQQSPWFMLIFAPAFSAVGAGCSDCARAAPGALRPLAQARPQLFADSPAAAQICYDSRERLRRAIRWNFAKVSELDSGEAKCPPAICASTTWEGARWPRALKFHRRNYIDQESVDAVDGHPEH